MLVLNIHHLCAARGYESAAHFLRKYGFSNHLSHKLTAKTQTTIPLAQMEQLCCLFKCTPNDLLEWIPEKGMDVAAHPLSLLKKTNPPENIFSSLTYEQLREAAKIISQTAKKDAQK